MCFFYLGKKLLRFQIKTRFCAHFAKFTPNRRRFWTLNAQKSRFYTHPKIPRGDGNFYIAAGAQNLLF